MDRWMDDLQFYVLFDSISVISGRWADDNEGFVQWNPVYVSFSVHEYMYRYS